MDARLQKLHLERRPGETLHQFAARISGSGGEGSAGEGSGETGGGEAGPVLDEAAAWYQQYALVRYGATADRLAIEQLAQGLPHE